jgi:hypothetical protein
MNIDIDFLINVGVPAITGFSAFLWDIVKPNQKRGGQSLTI